MTEIEVKNEFSECLPSQCRACLSVGRRLLRIGKYSDVYQKLIPNDITNSRYLEDVKLCWECHMQLHKTAKFQQQVIKANEMIRHSQSYVYGSLSSLTTVIINDTHLHTIYINETILKTDVKNEDIIPSYPNDITSSKDEKNNENSNDESDNDNLLSEAFVVKENEVINESKSKDIEIVTDDKYKIELKQNRQIGKSSKWAKEKALQNKKPKFKILKENEIVCNEMFRRVQIDINQLKECLTRERESSSFRENCYRCESCVLVFKTENLLMKHNSLRHDRKTGFYTCDICKASLSSNDLSRHVQKHYRRYECIICKNLCLKKNMKAHLMEKHGKIYQCLKCDLKFSCRQEFFKHFKDWHERFVCDYCGVSFKMRYCIKDHLKKKHSPIECSVCDVRFARYNSLWLHNKLRHAPPLPPAYCVECDKHYRDVYRYRWHLSNSAKHKAKKRVKIPCPDCEKVFSKKIYMTNHYEYVHLKNYKYHCETCDKNFIRNADLVKHKRQVHEGILPPKNKICNVCGRGFATNKVLNNHLRTHSGEKPFACGACPARFAQRAALRGHARALHPPQ